MFNGESVNPLFTSNIPEDSGLEAESTFLGTYSAMILITQ
jgi:hypothetical protein